MTHQSISRQHGPRAGAAVRLALLVAAVASLFFLVHVPVAVASGNPSVGLVRSLAGSAGSPTGAGTYNLTVPATQMWYPTGIVLANGDTLSIFASGSWNDGGGGGFNGPAGTSSSGTQL